MADKVAKKFFISIFPKKTTVWYQLYMFRPQKVIEKDRTIYVLSGKKNQIQKEVSVL